MLQDSCHTITMSIKRFAYNNSLTIVLITVFLLCIIGMSIAGWISNNDTLAEHTQPLISYGSYITGGEFGEGVFENWESEFLQMWALIILTIYLHQKGSADSKPLRGKSPQDTSSRYSIIRASSWRKRGKAAGHFLYRHSLSLAMFTLFIVSFSLHAIEGVSAYNEEAARHNSSAVSLVEYVASPQFWYESLQNWQSEFLAIAVLLILSIKLREHGSPESKPVGKKYDHATGGE
jgi:hypothetical protein